MNLRFLIIYYFISTVESDGVSSNSTYILTDKKGWKISADFSTNRASFTFIFSSKSSSLAEDWAGLFLNMTFSQNARIIVLQSTSRIIRINPYIPSVFLRYKMIHNQTTFPFKNTSSFEVAVRFRDRVSKPNEIIQEVSINREVIFSKGGLTSKFPPINNLRNLGRGCYLFTEIINYKVQSFEVTISFNSSALLKAYSGVFLAFIIQDVLQEIRSSDFKVVRNDENQWTLIDFGYSLKINETIETTMTFVSNDHIRNPIPLSIILNDEILCGFHPRDFRDPFLTKKNEKDLSNEESFRGDLHQIGVILYINLAFFFILGVCAIVATYQWITWKRYNNQMILGIWNKIHGQRYWGKPNNLNDFADVRDVEYSECGI